MPYQSFVAVALAIHILINIDMFIKKDRIHAIKSYRLFLISIASFYISDLLWGIFDQNKLRMASYIDTVIYYVLMGLIVLSWTRFVIKYLEGNKIFSNIVRIIGIAFFITEITLLIVNFFQPILFEVNEEAVYIPHPARDIILWIQIGMYSLIAIYSIVFILLRRKENLRRYTAIVLFSLAMITCISIQLSDPFIPFYSIGCLVGICILNTSALGDKQEQIEADLVKTSEIKEEKEQELDKAITIAYTDALTGVKSRYAFVEKELLIDQQIANHEIDDFAVIVFDINGLKMVNDKYGHQKGDELIKESVNIIQSIFPFELIYRFGGDEFVIILEGDNVKKYLAKHIEFTGVIDQNIHTGKPIISSGVSQFRPSSDNSFNAVFYRADKMMYNRKDYLKEQY